MFLAYSCLGPLNLALLERSRETEEKKEGSRKTSSSYSGLSEGFFFQQQLAVGLILPNKISFVNVAPDLFPLQTTLIC